MSSVHPTPIRPQRSHRRNHLFQQALQMHPQHRLLMVSQNLWSQNEKGFKGTARGGSRACGFSLVTPVSPLGGLLMCLWGEGNKLANFNWPWVWMTVCFYMLALQWAGDSSFVLSRVIRATYNFLGIIHSVRYFFLRFSSHHRVVSAPLMASTFIYLRSNIKDI